MKQKIGYVFLLLIFGIAAGWIAFSSINLLTNSSRQKEVTIDWIGGSVEYSHKFEGIIPLGTDYYYIGVNSNTGDVYILRTTPKWVNEHFVGNASVDPNGYTFTAVDCKLSGSDLKKAVEGDVQEIISTAPLFAKRGLEQYHFLYPGAATPAIIGLILVISAVIFLILGIFFAVKRPDVPTWGKTAYGILLIVWALAFALYLTRFGLAL